METMNWHHTAAMPHKTSLSLAAILMVLNFTGCSSGPSYTGPKILTWNVIIESNPPGAELSWRTRKEEATRPLGKAPATAAIPLPVDDLGFFDDVFVYATVGNKTSFVTTNDILVGGPLSSEGYHRAEKFAQLPSRITVNAYKAFQFETHGRLEMLREYEKNPERWAPYVTSLEGKVLSIQESHQGCVVQLFVEGQKNVIVYWPLETMRGVSEGTYLKVLGNVRGRTSGTNVLGGTVSALTLQAHAYVADWILGTPTTDYVPSRKALFDRWAEGSLFAGDGLVTVQ